MLTRFFEVVAFFIPVFRLRHKTNRHGSIAQAFEQVVFDAGDSGGVGCEPDAVSIGMPVEVYFQHYDDVWLPYLSSHGFPDATARTAAHAKAKAWLDAKKK